jgi:exodeoxyribonuclease VII large subunit
MNYISLNDLNLQIKYALSDNLESAYWVVAEIGELRVDRSAGHCYMELVEKKDEKIIAKIRATIWSTSFKKISNYFETTTGSKLTQGMKILFNGSVIFHEQYGLSVNIKEVDPNYTLGERARKKQEIIEKLKAEGVFEMNKETELPVVAQRLAIISSPTAAGYEDFMAQISNNSFGYFFSCKLFAATMQGNSAPESMIQALHKINSEIDEFEVVVIIRGGGAQLDLDCFDNYDLATHVAQFPIPVLSGIGHERDETIVDMVVHTKLKTPTAVAEFLIGRARSFEELLDQTKTSIINFAKSTIEAQSLRIFNLSRRFQLSTNLYINKSGNNLNNLLQGLKNYSSNSLERRERNIEVQLEYLLRVKERLLNRENERINLFENTLRLLDPSNVLKRGYSITYLQNKVIKNGTQIQAGENIKTVTFNKIIHSKIETIEDKNNGRN